MPPLVQVEVVVRPPSHHQWTSSRTKKEFKPARNSIKYDDMPLPVGPMENALADARIVGRETGEDGVHYHLKIGEVDLNDVAVEEVLDFVSARDLEEFENREFEEEREVLEVVEAEQARLAEERKVERRKERAKTKGTVTWESESDELTGEDEESGGGRGRRRPDYTQFYPKGDQRVKEAVARSDDDDEEMVRVLPADDLAHASTGHALQPLHTLAHPVKRRRRRRDPVTGELMPLKDKSMPLMPLTKSSSPLQEPVFLDHRKRPRRKRHPITREMMPLGWRYNPNAPEELRQAANGEPSLNNLSITDEPGAKRIRLGLDGTSSRASTPALDRVEAMELKARPTQATRDVDLPPSRTAVVSLLDSDEEDEDMDDWPPITKFINSTPKSPAAPRSTNHMLQSALSPRGDILVSSPSNPVKTSMLSPSAAHVVSTEPSADENEGGGGSGEESEEEWFVERIVGHTWSDPDTHPPEFGKESVVLYQVKWFDYEGSTWEPAESFDDMSTIADYRKRVGLKKITPLPSGPSSSSVPLHERLDNRAMAVDEDESGDEVEYEVERIMGHRMSDPSTHPGKEATMLYKVKWKGYEKPTSSWEPAASFEGTEEVLRRYRERHGLSLG